MKVAIIADIHANFAALKFSPRCALFGKQRCLSFKCSSHPFQSTVVKILNFPIFAAVQKQVNELITTGDLTVEKD